MAAQPKGITIEDIQAALSPQSVCVEIVEYRPRYDDHDVSFRQHDPKPPARYAAYLVFPDRFDWVDLGPAAPIDAHITAFRRALQLEQPIPTDLHRAVMQPILSRLPEDTRRIVIAPDGALNLVPFGALFDGERYLIEKYALRYVTTGRDLLPPVRDPVTTTSVTVVANPLGADLSGAELEADVLAGLFPDIRVLRRADATETNLRTVERPLVLHMATHGFFGPALHERDNPMLRSGIHLADVDQLPATAIDRELDDGRLTAYEVSGWDLRGTQLVVLSACETGLGTLHMGEGVLGLRRAFAMAGAQTQVMSLWQVGDVTAQKLMTAYYRALAEGKGRGEAMQAVQLEMLRSKEHHHPHDWAAFVVTGDDAPMAFPAGQEPVVAHAQDPEPGPPPHRSRRGGCSTAGMPSAGDLPTAWLLLGLLGLIRRRRRS